MIAGDTGSLGEFYTDSALFAETGAATMQGLPALKKATAAVFACCRYLESKVHPLVTEVSGGRAFQFATYRDVIQPAGQPAIALYGRFSAILDHDSSKGWRVARIVVIRDSSTAAAAGTR